MLPEGTLAELINGNLYMSPSPTKNHQRVVKKLSYIISDYIDSNQLGEVFLASYDVFLDESANAVQPDIIFVSSAKSTIAMENGIHGTPDLLIEILLPGNSQNDRVVKKGLYEKFGVQEYWIIDPDTKEALGYALKNNVYSEIGGFNAKIISQLLQKEFIF